MSYIQKVIAVIPPGVEIPGDTRQLQADIKAIQEELAQDTPWLIYAGLATGTLYAKEVKVG